MEQYQTTFQPIEEKMAQEAMDYGNAADQERPPAKPPRMSPSSSSPSAAAQRQLDVDGRQAERRHLHGGQSRDGRQRGRCPAAAMTGTRQAVKDKGVSLRAGAAAFGRNQTNTAGQQLGLSTGSGSAATQSAGAGVGSTMAAGSQVAGGYGAQIGAANTSIQANLGMGGLMNAAYGNAQMYGAQLAWGSLPEQPPASMESSPAAEPSSSKAPRRARRPSIRARPSRRSRTWTWIPGSTRDGVADGGRHVGPYAEDVQRELGDEVAPVESRST
jgi:hypothetical protein